MTTSLTTWAAESCGVSLRSLNLMPRGMPASWVIRASWPPPTMPTTGNVTHLGYPPPRHPLSPEAPGRRRPGHSLATPLFDADGHVGGSLVSMSGLTLPKRLG